jgi:lysozyme
MNNRQINLAGFKLITSFEGCRLTSYKDQVGVWTIAYGHTGADVGPNMVIDQNKADALLESDLSKFENGVSDLVEIEINDNQFSALVCFSYNLGLGALKSSHLLKYVNDLMFERAAEEFPKWSRAGGQEIEGLLRRRLAEQSLFKA